MHDGIHALGLRGDLKRSDGRWLAAELEGLSAGGARTIRLELHAVTYVDPAIARMLLSFAWRLERDRRRLVLARADRKVRWMLRWAGAGHLLVP